MFLSLMFSYLLGTCINVVRSNVQMSQGVPHTKIVGRRLINSKINPRIETMIGVQMCLRECDAMSSCLSINYDRSNLRCELNDFKETASNPLVQDDKYFYAEIERLDSGGNNCNKEICNKGSTCITTKTSGKVCVKTDYIRLVNGSLSSEGLVYVYRNGEWGTVCDDGFGMEEANVVCKSLGFQRALTVHHSASLGVGSGLILMDDVVCTGYEETIFNCTYITKHNCNHQEDVGVTCEN